MVTQTEPPETLPVDLVQFDTHLDEAEFLGLLPHPKLPRTPKEWEAAIKWQEKLQRVRRERQQQALDAASVIPIVTCDSVGDFIIAVTRLESNGRFAIFPKGQQSSDCGERIEGLLSRSGYGLIYTSEWFFSHGDLARYFAGIEIGTPDPQLPQRTFLRADPERVERWRNQLKRHKRPWIGFAWTGGHCEQVTEQRSLPP